MFFSKVVLNIFLLTSFSVIATTLFESERLYFREFCENDETALVSILGDPEVMEYCISYPAMKKIYQAMSLEEIRAFIARVKSWYKEYGFGWFAVVKKEDNKLIGYCGLRMHTDEGTTYSMLGYRLAKKFWNYGYATEAGKATLTYARDILKLSEVIAVIDPTNTKSMNVIQKIGFSFWKIGTFHDFPFNFYRIVL